ncbi:TPA: hypothetical protein DEP90_02235 [Patescibacteria group bacterium]|nr:hypothetical protein [Patescibacteria group bacterium]
MKIGPKVKKYIIHLLLTTVFGGVIGLLNYLFNIGLARFSSEEVFSIYAAAIGLIYLIQIPTISIQSIITKSIGESKDGDISRFKVKSFLIFTLMGIGFGIIFLIFTPLIANTASIPEYVIPSLAITLTLAFITPISRGILLGKERIVTVNLILFVETVFKFVLGYLAIKIGSNINLLILANSLPAFLSCIVILPLIKTNRLNKRKIKINFKELLLITIGFLLLSVPYTVDLILVPTQFRAEYAALSLIGKLVYFASITIAAVMFARLSNQRNKRDELKTLGITIGVTSLIGFGMTVGIFLFKDLIINFAFGGKYAEISTYFILFGFCMSLYAITFLLANFFFSKGSYWYISILLLVTVLQIILFKYLSTDIGSVVRNQVVVYVTLLVLTLFYLLLRKKERNF